MSDTTDVKYWLDELDAAAKRDKTFRVEGERINGIYACKDSNKVPFNILYSNTDTILPALYSALPRPVVQRRFKDSDPVALASCQAAERIISYFLDTNIDGYETFNDAMQCVVIDALLPGRGITRIKYDAEIGEYLEREGEEVDQLEGDQQEDANEPGLKKESEAVCIESISWDKVLFGYAKKWSKMPWIAFEEEIDKDEAIRLFGKEVANKLKFVGDDDDDDKGNKIEEEHTGERKTATIYQIWDRDGGRKIRYVSRQNPHEFLKVDDDTLELSGFYPIPKPLELLAKSNDMSVTAPYLIYENQAKELNELTRRISRLSKTIKSKFVYDSELGDDIAALLEGDDNIGIPADKSAALASDKGFENAIWFMPIEQMVRVLAELYQAREACKQTIYEVTGISDIIRGSTNANETATAQGLKSQWGTLRLKRNQAEVQRYARDLMRIMLEIAATKFSEETWVDITNLEYATEQRLAYAQQIQMAAQQYAPQLQQMQQSGQPISPQYQQAMDEAQQIMSLPKWSDVLNLLKSDMHKSYRIDVETNSTLSAEAAGDQQQMSEALNAISTFWKESIPLIQEGVFPFHAAKSMLETFIRRFQCGDQLEGFIDEMKEPPPPPQPPQAPPDNSVQIKQMDIQHQQQLEQMKAQALAQQQQLEAQKEAQSEQGRIAAEREKRALQTQVDAQKNDLALHLDAQKIEAARIIEQGKAETQMRIKQMEIDAQLQIKQMELDATREMEEFKANLASSTTLTVAEMSKESAAAEPDETDTGLQDYISEAMKELIDHIKKPKMAIFDENGRITGIQHITEAN